MCGFMRDQLTATNKVVYDLQDQLRQMNIQLHAAEEQNKDLQKMLHERDNNALRICLFCENFMGDYDYDDGGSLTCAKLHMEEESLVPWGYQDNNHGAENFRRVMKKAETCEDWSSILGETNELP